ncbi:helix-turn-helix transcriptional regulator [Anaerolinea sp.]|uniref:helix-turn-helix domain-containing protein n=1 Tax=Anaerolinea sp. TaxID=1872519 RepID=UPI002ACE1F3E|nr:helix-turn-helix transcriptional regulator [Anaerolinea sp.]
MPDLPIGRARLLSYEKPYDPQPMIERLKALLKKHNESYREAALRAGLDHQAVRRILAGQRPSIPTCILLADHFGVNPNEFLELAGLPKLKIFDVQDAQTEHLPVEAIEVARDIARIKDPGIRRQVAEAIRTLLAKYFE